MDLRGPEHIFGILGPTLRLCHATTACSHTHCLPGARSREMTAASIGIYYVSRCHRRGMGSFTLGAKVVLRKIVAFPSWTHVIQPRRNIIPLTTRIYSKRLRHRNSEARGLRRDEYIWHCGRFPGSAISQRACGIWASCAASVFFSLPACAWKP